MHGLIPPDSCKIDNLNQATPAQLKRLKDGLAVTEAMQEIRRAELPAKNSGNWGDAALAIVPFRPVVFLEP